MALALHIVAIVLFCCGGKSARSQDQPWLAWHGVLCLERNRRRVSEMSADRLAGIGKPTIFPTLGKWCLWALQFAASFAAVAVILYLVLLLPGCAQIGNLPAPGIHPGDSPLTQREFVRADVEAALAIATAGGDKRGEACFTEILRVLPTSSPSPTQPTGLISIYEAGRVARLGLQAGLPDSAVSACAPMVLNSQRALLHAISFANGMP